MDLRSEARNLIRQAFSTDSDFNFSGWDVNSGFVLENNQSSDKKGWYQSGNWESSIGQSVDHSQGGLPGADQGVDRYQTKSGLPGADQGVDRYQTKSGLPGADQQVDRYRVEQIESNVARYIGYMISRKTPNYRGNPEDLVNDSSVRDLYINQVVLLSLGLAKTTYTGYYALIYNQALRVGVINPDLSGALPKFVESDVFPEVFDNYTLTNEERTIMKQRFDSEYSGLREAFLQRLSGSQEDYFDENCLFSKCLDQTCIVEKMNNRNILPGQAGPPDRQIFQDYSPEAVISQTFCLPTITLLIALNKDPPINPLTGIVFSNETLNTLRSRFQIELKLVRYAMQFVVIPEIPSSFQFSFQLQM